MSLRSAGRRREESLLQQYLSRIFPGRGAGRFLAHYVRVGMTADRNDRVAIGFITGDDLSLRSDSRRRGVSFSATTERIIYTPLAPLVEGNERTGTE